MTVSSKPLTLTLNARPLSLTLTAAARTALQQRTAPLYVQMELYFSCLLRLKVRFYDVAPAMAVDWIPAAANLLVSFRPVMTAHCSNDYEGEEPPLTDFPLSRDAPFTPRWLHLDFRHNAWHGEFGYQIEKASG